MRQRFEKHVSEMLPFLQGMPWSNKFYYASWLAQQYFLVRHTPRLMCAFALRVPMDRKSDFNHAVHHLQEEMGHDQWLLNDLKSLGFEISNFTPLAATQALIKSQYYQIQQEVPLSFAGYTQFLECLATEICNPVADQIEPLYGRRAVTFLRGHGAADVEHTQDGWRLLSGLPEPVQMAVIENLEMTVSLYRQIFTELAQNLPAEKNTRVLERGA